jgi:hypothetical protein
MPSEAQSSEPGSSKIIFGRFGTSHPALLLVSEVCKTDESSDGDNEVPESGLDDAAKADQEVVRERLREDLKREPSQEEIDEWLRRHTESY